jgi:fructose-1,6-bisphosphatase/inositol monophosphatase family enzyme
LIVREAGGSVTDPAGAAFVLSDDAANDVVAGNPHLQAKLREVVADGVAAAAPKE